MNFFPFRFSFEQAVADYTMAYMEKITTPTATAAFHKGLPPKLTKQINEELTAYNLPLLANINAWKKHPGEVQVLHVDVYAWDKVNGKSKSVSPNKAAFNIPVCNTQGSRMVWYSGRHTPRETEILTPSGTRATYFEIDWHEEYHEEEELELLTPHFVSTCKPHRVYANPHDTRILASVRLQGNPSIESLYDILKDR